MSSSDIRAILRDGRGAVAEMLDLDLAKLA